jgi:hypothetical protein
MFHPESPLTTEARVQCHAVGFVVDSEIRTVFAPSSNTFVFLWAGMHSVQRLVTGSTV